LKRDVVALWFAARDRHVPVMAKIVAGATAAYALSPIDLIPDFIPVLGYLDDLILVPLGVWLALRLIPEPLMAEFRLLVSERLERPVSLWAAAMILLVWIAISLFVARRLFN
jgi:uncharacterized membrane protein YkvA (DUF1232 family)